MMPEISGRLVRLRPLTEDDAPALLASITTDEVWAWKPVPHPSDVEEMRSLVCDVMIGANGDRVPLAVLRLRDGRLIGSTTLHQIDLRHRSAEIGWTWLARDCWGQRYNEDMKYALLEYCFGSLGLCRIQWTVDSANLRSQHALERLGFVKEGLLRSHRVRVDLTRADTVVYSTLVEEWPETEMRLQALIADAE